MLTFYFYMILILASFGSSPASLGSPKIRPKGSHFYSVVLGLIGFSYLAGIAASLIYQLVKVFLEIFICSPIKFNQAAATQASHSNLTNRMHIKVLRAAQS